MVNVPPIPPLLCSTPPPIDFGDEDEDVDVLPTTLGGAPDEEFGDFLAVDDSKSNDESLPSPRPPSVTDLPPMSIYDGLTPPDEAYTNHITSHSPPPVDHTASTKSKEITNNNTSTRQSTPIVEAFNYSITNQIRPADNEITNTEDELQEEEVSIHRIVTPTSTEDVTQEKHSNDHDKIENFEMSNETIVTVALEKDAEAEINKHHLTQAINAKSNSDVVKHNVVSPLTNIVSIEDLEDDLSEDELYSPKTPKNFTDIDDMSNFFAIHEIRPSEYSHSQSTEVATSAENKEAKANTNDSSKLTTFANFASHKFPAQNLDVPPPLDEQAGDDNDDFGDFADFQDFTSISTETQSPKCNTIVPVNNSKTNELSNEVEEDNFEEFMQENHQDEKTNINVPVAQVPGTINASQEKQGIAYHNEDEDFENFTTHDVGNFKDFAHNDSSQKEPQANSHLNNNIDMPEAQDNLNVELFNEAENKPEDNCTEAVADKQMHLDITTGPNLTNDNEDDDDDFGDFADFDQHHITPAPEKLETEQFQSTETDETTSREDTINDAGTAQEDDDDDFGDFNTAEPMSAAAPHVAKSTIPSSQVATAPTTLQTSVNLNERISIILQLMFTPSGSPPNSPTVSNEEPKAQKIQDIPFTSIDAAKALEYQWLNSETRHSFIKSLGIDSRNILYGENWNPSLPRFAANLSFNPLKPMKPVTSNSSGADTNTTTSSCPSVEPVSVNNNSDFNKPITNNLGNTKRDNHIELDWKASSAVTATAEQTIEASQDHTLTPDVPVPKATSGLYQALEPPESLTIFENRLDNDDKISKTPPISEMESVNTFSSPIPASIPALDVELPAPQPVTQILNDFKRNTELHDTEDLSKDTLEVVVTSTTFAGSFKETHIYTPPKTAENTSSSSSSSVSTTSPSKATNIDFDYEKAAMGVIIDETVVKKEYRDIEYNSPFSMDSLMKTSATNANGFANITAIQGNSPKIALNPADVSDEFNEEFSDFQSVSSEPVAAAPTATQAAASSLKSSLSSSSNPSSVVSDLTKPSNVSSCGMILSPAILIPQAISMESQKPKIEWGDSTTSINPEELARIEELFPEPKSLKSNNSSSSQRSTPTHQANPIVVTAPSISAAVANKELEGNNDDDDWSDFVSVPVANNNKALTNNNLVVAKSPSKSPFKQRSPVNPHRMPPHQNYNNSNNDDEWSDFVSGAPPSAAAQVSANTQQSSAYRGVPQFNSGAWQNANFYNNPLSLYHKGPLNLNSSAGQHQPPKNFLNNNNNYTQQYNHFQTSGPHSGQAQQIHIMQNFSTAPVPTPERHSSASMKNNQFQVGSAKVAPSIALIPDLGFVAPAIPTHTSFINSLPKPSINTKK